MSITMNIMTQFFNKKHLLLFYFIFDNEDILKGHLSTWHNTYNMHGKKIVQKKFVYCFRNDNTHMN